MKRLLLIISMSLTGFSVFAGESGSQVAWDQETLNFVKKGNAEKGGNLAQTCKACHGERGEGSKSYEQDGEKIEAVPAIAGQLPTYTYKQLRDYANGDRENASMTGIAKSLSEQDAADLAVWYSSLSLPRHEAGADDKKLAAAQKLAEDGDGKRILPPCFVCHGAQGQGEKMDIPGLAGQQAEYFEKTLLAYKKSERHNDIYSRMRLISQQLTDEEIRQLSLYYQQLK